MYIIMTKKSETYSYPIFNLENKESSDLIAKANTNQRNIDAILY